MNKEYTYDIGKYTIGVDTNGEDGIGMTVAKIENGDIYFLGNCYGENARCIDLLIKENQELKIQISAREEEYRKLENKVNKIIETIDEELIYDKGTDITSAIGDVGEKMKFYLSDCEFLNEFRKLERGESDEI